MSGHESPAYIAQQLGYVNTTIHTCIAFIVLDTVFVGLRFLSRTVKKGVELGWDDWLILPAWATNIGVCAVSIYVAHWTGMQVNAESKQSAISAVESTLHGVFALQVIYVVAFSFAKLSIVALYLRIFATNKTRKICWALIGFITLNCIAYFFASIFFCHPVWAFWSIKLASTNCIHYDAFDRSIPGPNLFSDIVILIVPLPTILRLIASASKRAGIAFTMLTGSVGMIACIIRWVYFIKNPIKDWDYKQQCYIVILTVIEASMYLIAACMPPLRGLLASMSGERISSTFSTLFRSGRRTLGSGSNEVPMHTLDDQQRTKVGSFSKLVDRPDYVEAHAIAKSTGSPHPYYSPSGQGPEKNDIEVRRDVWVE